MNKIKEKRDKVKVMKLNENKKIGNHKKSVVGPWKIHSDYPKICLEKVQDLQKVPNLTNGTTSIVTDPICDTESPNECIEELERLVANHLHEFEVLKNQLHQINAHWQKKYDDKIAAMKKDFDTELKRQIDCTKLKKWCFICLNEVTFNCITKKPVCSANCLKKLIDSNGTAFKSSLAAEPGSVVKNNRIESVIMNGTNQLFDTSMMDRNLKGNIADLIADLED